MKNNCTVVVAWINTCPLYERERLLIFMSKASGLDTKTPVVLRSLIAASTIFVFGSSVIVNLKQKLQETTFIKIIYRALKIF
jgi:hypothetical protein